MLISIALTNVNPTHKLSPISVRMYFTLLPKIIGLVSPLTTRNAQFPQ